MQGLSLRSSRDARKSPGSCSCHSSCYTQPDPIDLAGGLNGYAYVDANPVTGFDPNGLLALVDPNLSVLGRAYANLRASPKGAAMRKILVNKYENPLREDFGEPAPIAYPVPPQYHD